MRQEDDKIKNEDYRLQFISTTSDDWKSPFTGFFHPKGTPVMLTAEAKHGDDILSFGIPNATALFINLSHKLWQESRESLNQESFIKKPNEHTSDNLIIPKKHDLLFDYIEKRMGAIVFAYSAIEAFANEYIPDDYVFEKTRADEKCIEKYDKAQIESYVALDTKLAEILPKIMEVNGPKGTHIWNKFKDLKKLRDRIIHMKTRDRRQSHLSDDTIWKPLLDKKYPDYSFLAKEIIGAYFKKVEKPRWYENFPY